MLNTTAHATTLLTQRGKSPRYGSPSNGSLRAIVPRGTDTTRLSASSDHLSEGRARLRAMGTRQPRRRRRRSAEATAAAAVRRTQRGAARAYEAAAELGPFEPVEPVSRHAVDDFPQIGPDQVYAFRAGTVYHRLPCQVVMHQWDSAPDTVKVLEVTTVGLRKLCGICSAKAV